MKNRKPETKQEVIIELWRQTGKDAVGAAELDLIQQGLLERFGASAVDSPASIARALADEGAQLQHPEILEADFRWRQERTTALFSPEDLNLETIEAATSLMEKIERLRRQFEESGLEHLRESVRRMKSEVELLAATEKTQKRRQIAEEFVQWLTVWLQNPQIFAEWLGLRRVTADFRERFE